MSGADADDATTCAERGELPRASQRWPRFDLVCRVQSYPGGDECTVSPADAPEDDVTTWLTAKGDAFVSLANCR
ncbi:DUF7511 domain-containing protein [Salarchaeum japonicum]|uniref:DUF7511 domain-containing protein n=1 Tax=Salarchaeum japonicum TaxID=555573 RepID=UPI003C766A1E